jgi:hypothetical protein
MVAVPFAPSIWAVIVAVEMLMKGIADYIVSPNGGGHH